MEDTLHFDRIHTQTIEAEWLRQRQVQLDVLRIDLLHAMISGNKWFKLKYYLFDAREKGFDTIATFGGPYSNHIIATAFACKYAGIRSMGIIRGERPPVLSSTLAEAQDAGMELQFVSRGLFSEKSTIREHFNSAIYWINEGGYGALGALGAKDILIYSQQERAYTHIFCAVGTGTMMAGLVAAAQPHQQVTGISVMKGNYMLTDNVAALLEEKDAAKNFDVIHDYHFGGYAKHPPELIRYMNETWQQHQLPTDIVYTSKTFYAIEDRIKGSFIPPGSRILMIHSGGLQGNDSLPEKTLAF